MNHDEVQNAGIENEATDGAGLRRRTILGAGAAFALGTAFVTAAPAMAATGNGQLKVGAGKAAISIPDSLLPIDNFTTVHDPLYVRVLLVENAVGKIALVVLDLTSISAEAIANIRSVVTQKTGVPSGNIMVTVTHCFSAPHVMSSSQSAQEATWINNITAAATAAVSDAQSGLQPAKVGYGTGTCDVNVNRNVETAQGYWLGTNESQTSSKQVGVARFDDKNGNPIAILTNYNVQSAVMMDSVMANGDRPITADLAGAAVAHVEQQYGGNTVGFFLVGSCGDQFPAFRSNRYVIDKDKNWSMVDAHDAGWILLTVQGERLGTEIVRVAQTIKPRQGAGTTVKFLETSTTVKTIPSGHPSGPVTTYDFTPTGTQSVPIWVFQIGTGIFAGVAPELSTSTSLTIKSQSKFESTFVMSMFEGGDKNMADRWNYKHITYPAMDGNKAEGAAEKVASEITRTIGSFSRK